jgi:hypothetical protein
MNHPARQALSKDNANEVGQEYPSVLCGCSSVTQTIRDGGLLLEGGDNDAKKPQISRVQDAKCGRSGF